MTIYLIKWLDKDDNGRYQQAFSSFTAAQKELKSLSKDPQLEFVDSEDGPIHVVKPKTQTDVINLINSL